MSSISFHIDLSHIQDKTGILLEFDSQDFELISHTAATLNLARQANLALAALPVETCQRFTHFVELPQSLFHEHRSQWVRVIRPNCDPAIYVPDYLLMNLYIPEAYRRKFFQKKLQENPDYLPAVLESYGLKNETALSNRLAVCLAAVNLVTVDTTAATLLFHHPEMATQQPYAQPIVLDHISPSQTDDPDQYNRMQDLTTYMTNNPKWCNQTVCHDAKNQPLTAEYTAHDKDGNVVFQEGDTLQNSELTPETLQAVGQPMSYARRSACNDSALQNQTWLVNQGTTAIKRQQSSSQTGNQTRQAVNGPNYDWTLENPTYHYGIDVDGLTVDSQGNVSVAVANSYLRTVYAAYQLLDDSGNPIPNSKTDLQVIPATGMIFGIPIATSPVTLKFNIQQAGRFQLMFGSLGKIDEWQDDPCIPGTVCTGIAQYLIPTLLLATMTLYPFSSFIRKFLVNLAAKELIAVFSSLSLTGKLSLPGLVYTFAGAALGMLFRRGWVELGTYVVAQMTAGQAQKAAGPVGWAFALVAAGLDVELMAVTSGEVGTSPALVTVNASSSINVALTLNPDRAHGEAGNPSTAVWPAIAHHYQVQLEYKDGGTPIVLKGDLATTTNSTPINLTFNQVIAGSQSQFQITAGVYSDSGWLCGTWQSDWIKAVLPSNANGDTLDLGPNYITEILTPLTQDTQYEYVETLAYQNNQYVWQQGKPPQTTVSQLNCGNTGTLCELVDITFSPTAQQIGYIWRASGQYLPLDQANKPPSAEQEYVVQNLSTLAHPGWRYRKSKIGFSNQPCIAYSGAIDPKQINQNNFILDPRNGEMHLRQVVLTETNSPTDFGLTSDNLLSWGKFPIANLDAIAIHPQNVVVGISYQYHKLMILPLPANGVSDDQAPTANLLSGYGVLQGLMHGPKAMAIAPDERILILEADPVYSRNNALMQGERVQAFDTKGNPVPSFASGQAPISVSTQDGGVSFAAALDAGTIPDLFQTTLQNNSITYLTFLDSSLTKNLDSGAFQPTDPSNDPVIHALSLEGVVLAYDPNNMGDHTVSAYITVNQPGQSWTITDPTRRLTYLILNQSGALLVFYLITQYSITANEAGQQWTIYDSFNAITYQVARQPNAQGTFEITTQYSYFLLNNPTHETVQYLDMVVEQRGYIYVLSYVGDPTQGAIPPSAYRLDIYQPDGTFMVRIPDPTKTTNPQNIVADKLAIDAFRNVFTLNYETFLKPGNGPQPSVEPSISEWAATPPLFAIPNAQSDGITAQAQFNASNITVVHTYFQTGPTPPITLPQDAFITILSPQGYWIVGDSSVKYSVVLSSDKLYVYSIPV